MTLALQERTKTIMFEAFAGEKDDINDWITFETLFRHWGGGFDLPTGTYTVPESGTYLFGLSARSGKLKKWTKVGIYKNNIERQTIVTEGNEKDYWNNLGTTWILGLNKGDKLRLRVTKGTVDSYLFWWGFLVY